MLGRGSFGQVVKAKDKKSGELVAIKHMKVNHESKHAMIQVYRELSIL